jgi:hypothetical protein
VFEIVAKDPPWPGAAAPAHRWSVHIVQFGDISEFVAQGDRVRSDSSRRLDISMNNWLWTSVKTVSIFLGKKIMGYDSQVTYREC